MRATNASDKNKKKHNRFAKSKAQTHTNETRWNSPFKANATEWVFADDGVWVWRRCDKMTDDKAKTLESGRGSSRDFW